MGVPRLLRINDVCAILGYVDSKRALPKNLDDDKKKSRLKFRVISTPNYHEGKVVYISESGLYSLILTSGKIISKNGGTI